jgi:hypothetical protein
MAQRVFKINELATDIAVQLVLIGEGSAASPACACRCLEVPVLSTLWEQQEGLRSLLRVLPGAVVEPKRRVVEKDTVRGLDLLFEELND